MKIGNRLFISFGGVFLLTLLVGLGLTSYVVLTLSGLTTKLYNHPFIVSNAVHDIHINVINIRVCMKDVALAHDRTSLEIAIRRIHAYEKEIHQNFEILKKRYLGDPEDVEKVVRIFAQWKPVREEIFDLKREGRQEETVQAVDEGAENQHLIEIEHALKVLTDFTSAKADIFLADSQAKAKEVAGLSLLMISLVLAIGAGIMVMVSRSITHPLRVALNVSDQVAEGSLDINFPVMYNDEIGQLFTLDAKNDRIYQKYRRYYSKNFQDGS